VRGDSKFWELQAWITYHVICASIFAPERRCHFSAFFRARPPLSTGPPVRRQLQQLHPTDCCCTDKDSTNTRTGLSYHLPLGPSKECECCRRPKTHNALNTPPNMADDRGSPCFEHCIFAIVPSKDLPASRVVEVRTQVLSATKCES
jgi:hypothetical protein